MGSCFSTSKVSGSNSNTPSTTAAAANNQRHSSAAKPQSATPSTATQGKQEGSRCNHRKTKENHKNQQQRQSQQVRKSGSKKPSGVIPCGKRTDFGYDKDFDARYTIGKLLGHGQFGYTYAAIDKSNGDRVAVKRIEKKKMVLPIAVEDVKREVKILKALTGHENVVQFYNAFEDDSYVYIVMELCEGGELLDRILSKKDSRYTEKDAAIIVRQMLKVAAECHLHGMVHRDMKPENFLFKSPKEDSSLKATDFGLSDFIRPGKKFQDIVGSAYYVAPEVLKRKSGPESDVWSIGVITYILLCGRRPFWDKTEDGIFKEVLRNKPDFRRKPWPTISNAAKDFVKKLLVKDPRARLTAAQALSHIWVREGGEASEIPLDISILSSMRQFVNYSRLKQFALRALASTLDVEEIADLRDQFDAIDVDKSGAISLEEMRQKEKMSLALLQSYSSAEEDELVHDEHLLQDQISSDDDANDAVPKIRSYKPLFHPNPQSSSSLPSAFDAFSEIAGPPQFLNNSVEEDPQKGAVRQWRHGSRKNRKDKKHLPSGAVVESKVQLVGIRERVRSDVENTAPQGQSGTSVGTAQGGKRVATVSNPNAEDAAELLRMCVKCGIPKTYSHAKGMICPVCGDRPPTDSDKEPVKKKGSMIKDKEKSKRMRGQSTHASWKSETEMHLRQQFD